MDPRILEQVKAVKSAIGKVSDAMAVENNSDATPEEIGQAAAEAQEASAAAAESVQQVVEEMIDEAAEQEEVAPEPEQDN